MQRSRRKEDGASACLWTRVLTPNKSYFLILYSADLTRISKEAVKEWRKKLQQFLSVVLKKKKAETARLTN